MDYRGSPVKDELDQHIERLLAVDPSPEFLARVRSRVARERVPAAWRAGWTWGVVGAAATLVVAVIVLVPAPASVGRSRMTSIDSRAFGPRYLEALPESVRAINRVTKAGPARAEPVRPRLEPKVLIASGEARALKRLLRGIPSEQAARLVGDAAVLDIPTLERPREIVVAPIPEIPRITIEPLQVAAVQEGVRQ
jgi:hypothetical protein